MPHDLKSSELVLASSSAVRADILTGAGLAFRQDSPGVDEAPIKTDAAQAGTSPQKIAEILALAKAMAVSETAPEALVIGADQVLVCQNRAFDKPRDLAEARAHLEALRGRTHRLETAVAAVRGGTCLWHYVTAPQLTLRDFSDAALEAYLERVGEQALQSVGAYQIEGPAIQLFERIEGDYFSVLGLPILPLLDFLRHEGWADT